MTDETAPTTPPGPAGAADPTSGRARIEAGPKRRSVDALPLLYLVGFVVLAGAMYFLWTNPPESRLGRQDASRLDTLQSQVTSLRDEVTALRSRPAPQPGPSSADFAKLQQGVAELAARPAPAPLQPLEAKVAALEARAAASPDQVAQVSSQVAALDRRVGDDQSRLQSLAGRLDDQGKEMASRLSQADAATGSKIAALTADLSGKLDALRQQGQQRDQEVKQLAQRTQLAVRLQAIATSLSAGHRLGEIAGAPPALARYAQADPPTEASLRGSFDGFAARAQAAGQPGYGSGASFGERMWARAQGSVTVRQGDHVLLGDSSAGVLAHARELLDNGDLAGAVKALGGLSGAAAQAMQPWVEQARNLLDARAALATLAAG